MYFKGQGYEIKKNIPTRAVSDEFDGHSICLKKLKTEIVFNGINKPQSSSQKTWIAPFRGSKSQNVPVEACPRPPRLVHSGTASANRQTVSFHHLYD